MIDELYKDLNNRKIECQKKIGERNMILTSISTAQSKIQSSRDLQSKNTQMIALLQQASELSRDSVKSHIEQICTAALRYVFDKDLEFVISIQEQKNTNTADFFIQYDNGVEKIRVKPEDFAGGGVIDVLSIALRFCYNELLDDPTIQGSIVLDEPAKMLSEIASPKAGMLIQELTDTFNRQVIMVTHNPVYAISADKTFQVSMNGTYSKILETTPTTQSVVDDPILRTSISDVDIGDYMMAGG